MHTYSQLYIKQPYAYKPEVKWDVFSPGDSIIDSFCLQFVLFNMSGGIRSYRVRFRVSFLDYCLYVTFGWLLKPQFLLL